MSQESNFGTKTFETKATDRAGRYKKRLEEKQLKEKQAESAEVSSKLRKSTSDPAATANKTEETIQPDNKITWRTSLSLVVLLQL